MGEYRKGYDGRMQEISINAPRLQDNIELVPIAGVHFRQLFETMLQVR
jgi:hypothetical protein